MAEKSAVWAHTGIARDSQNRARAGIDHVLLGAAYFAFKLLSRAMGERLGADSNDSSVHAFLSYDSSYGLYNLLVWNYSDAPVTLDLNVHDLPMTLVAKRRSLDAAAPSDDENVRLRPLPDLTLKPGAPALNVRLEPYGVESWSLEPVHHH